VGAQPTRDWKSLAKLARPPGGDSDHPEGDRRCPATLLPGQCDGLARPAGRVSFARRANESLARRPGVPQRRGKPPKIRMSPLTPLNCGVGRRTLLSDCG